MTEIINLAAALSLIQIWVYEAMPMFGRLSKKQQQQQGYVYTAIGGHNSYASIDRDSGCVSYSYDKEQAKIFNNIDEFKKEFEGFYNEVAIYNFEPKNPIESNTTLYTILNRKPFNCSSCLSFWIGLTLAILFLNPIYLTLYLFTEIYERYV